MTRASRKRRLVVATIAVFAVGLVAPAALAHVTGGNRLDFTNSWSNVGSDLIDGSDHSSGSGGIHNVYGHQGSQCPGAGNSYQIRLVHEVPILPDDFLPWKSYTCGVASNRQWNTSYTDNFHLDVQKVGGVAGNLWFIDGHVHYP